MRATAARNAVGLDWVLDVFMGGVLCTRDGVDGGQTGVSVLRDGKMLGGGSVLYHFGSYQCSEGKWKGEVTSREHTPTINVRPFAGHIATMGFAGTYTDEGAEFEATALVGKRSIRLKTVFRLLIAD
jgi:hypothetical protein